MVIAVEASVQALGVGICQCEVWRERGWRGKEGDFRGKFVKKLTNKFNSFVEPGADVGFVVVLHRNALILVVSLEVIWAVGRDVDEGCDAEGVQHVFSGCMICTAQIQKRQNLHRTTLRNTI